MFVPENEPPSGNLCLRFCSPPAGSGSTRPRAARSALLRAMALSFQAGETRRARGSAGGAGSLSFLAPGSGDLHLGEAPVLGSGSFNPRMTRHLMCHGSCPFRTRTG